MKKMGLLVVAVLVLMFTIGMTAKEELLRSRLQESAEKLLFAEVSLKQL